MASEDGWGLVAACIWISLIVAAVVLAVIACMTAGVVYGAGRSLVNYWIAFRRHVRTEGASA